MPAFRGTIVTARSAGRVGELQVLEDHVVVVDGASGAITAVAPASQQAEGAGGGDDVVRLSPAQLLLPGFIDCHVHAPQYEFCGTGTDLPLFEWLETYTFRTEAEFADRSHAVAVYEAVVRRLLSLGTTTAAYFSTMHVEACKALAEVVLRLGQRALVGKVCQDQQSPEFYVETAQEGVQGAAEVASYVAGLASGGSMDSGGRLLPCLIPRFTPTCSQGLLEGLGRLAQERGLRVHSHISESRDQVDLSARAHPGFDHDAAVFDCAGLLTRGSVMAHGTLLTDDALALLAARGVGIAHCPLSNMFFGDHLLDAQRAMAAGVHVGLGTDVAGGYSPSMLVAQRMAVLNGHAHKSASLMHDKHERVEAAKEAHEVTWRDAFCMATLGGAQALCLDHLTGSIEAGKQFDACIVDAGVGLDLFPRDLGQPLRLLEKWLNLGDDRQIAAVYVAGQLVAGSITNARTGTDQGHPGLS